MSEKITRLSAGVKAREIDLSAVSAQQPASPEGVPAGVIGIANRGPAFVPVTVPNSTEFVSVFGEASGDELGPIALREWLKNSRAGTFIRVLGAGDGKQSSSGLVTNAGFVVGDKIVQSDGDIGNNEYANGTTQTFSRTYFIGCLMSESNGSTFFTDAVGSTGDGLASSIRGVIFAPQGVHPRLKLHTTHGDPATEAAPTKTTVATDVGPQGSYLGSVENGHQATLFLNGFKAERDDDVALQISFDPDSPQYLSNVLNTDPLKIEEKGHYLYADFPVYRSQAVVTGSGRITEDDYTTTGEPIAFLLTGSAARETGSDSAPDFETFENRYQGAFSPMFISQDMGERHNLFKVTSLSDGLGSSLEFKVCIQNIKPSTDPQYEYGTFDLVVRDFNDTDNKPVILESFTGLNLDLDSEKYVCRVIGDQKVRFNFEDTVDSQSIVVEGQYRNNSKYIRIEPSSQLKSGQIPDAAIPFGFRGHYHLQTSGSALSNTADVAGISGNYIGLHSIQPPVPMIQNLVVGKSSGRKLNTSIYWGPQFTKIQDVEDPNKTFSNTNVISNFTKYFGDYRTTIANMWVGDNENADISDDFGVVSSDVFNNNIFALDNVRVITGSDAKADPKKWIDAVYVRNGNVGTSASNKTRALKVSDFEKAANRKFGKFTCFLQGGFDGVNIFDKEKSKLSNVAAHREFENEATQGGIEGPTIASYRKAIDIMATDADVDIKLLAIPGQRNQGVTDYAISAVESRFDSMYIMDIEEKDENDAIVTGSLQKVNIENTINNLKNRGLNTSFAATYFPDVIISHPDKPVNLTVPPSVVVLGAFSKNDTLGHPWFAPAGFNRTSLSNVIESTMNLKQENLDSLYDTKINPITSFSGTSLVIWGQKTLQQASNALDRVNVRRLLIEIRRLIRDAANRIIFEPNREETLVRFRELVDPILQNVQDNQGLTRFKVIIDTTTTTQADVENNTIRGKILLQPTKTIEFVALDFVVTNNGTEI